MVAGNREGSERGYLVMNERFSMETEVRRRAGLLGLFHTVPCARGSTMGRFSTLLHPGD
jgi:hypothetical protein